MREVSTASPAHASDAERERDLVRYINLKLIALGEPPAEEGAQEPFVELARPLLKNYHVRDQMLEGLYCPADQRIQSFLDSYLADVRPGGAPRLPAHTFVLDRAGLARVMSLPRLSDHFSSPYLDSYRVAQGVLHNPRSDRSDDARHFPHCGGRPAGACRQDRRAEAGLRGAAGARAAAAAGRAAAAIHSRAEAGGACVGFAAAAAGGGSGGAGRGGADHGDPLLRAGQPGEQPGLRRGHFRQCRRPVSAGERCCARRPALDRAHGLHHPGAASGGGDEEGARAAPLGRGHGTAAAGRDVLARGGRALQQRGRIQGHLPRPPRGDGDDHRRQLLRLLQEGGEDADQLLGQPDRPRRRGARRRRAAFPLLHPRAGLHRRPHGAAEARGVRGRDAAARGPGGGAAGTLCGGPEISVDLLRPRRQHFRRQGWRNPLAARRSGAENPAAGRGRVRAALRLPAAAGEAAERLDVAAWSARGPTVR